MTAKKKNPASFEEVRGGKADLEKSHERPADDRLHDALLMTFPASDPPAMDSGVVEGQPKPIRKEEKDKKSPTGKDKHQRAAPGTR